MGNKFTVISLGGSLIAPAAGLDVGLLRQFRKLLLGRIRTGERFVVVCGGGAVAREYQAAARRLAKLTAADADWLGIGATRLNAELVKAVFGRRAHPSVVTDPTKAPAFREPVLFAAGWKPGWSTDYVAVLLAKRFGAGVVINLSNIDHVYSADPKKDPAAKPYEQIGWHEFRKLVGGRWDPGANAPFDPVASKLAQKIGLTVRILNGRSPKDVAAALAGKHFKGTTIDAY